MQLAGLRADVDHAVGNRGRRLDGVAGFVGPQQLERRRQRALGGPDQRRRCRGTAASDRRAAPVRRLRRRALTDATRQENASRQRAAANLATVSLAIRLRLRRSANSWLRLTMKSVPLAGTGVE